MLRLSPWERPRLFSAAADLFRRRIYGAGAVTVIRRRCVTAQAIRCVYAGVPAFWAYFVIDGVALFLCSRHRSGRAGVGTSEPVVERMSGQPGLLQLVVSGPLIRSPLRSA